MGYWKFARLEAIENTGFDNSLEKFYGLGVEGLVRENIQNSMDAKIVDNDEPVEVYIDLGDITASVIPGIGEINSRIAFLKGENDYSRATIEHMNHEKGSTKTTYISFEDKNTRGLTGAKNGQNFSVNDTWGAYAYKKGVHPKEKDSDQESMRGGSHGIGKVASNAASDLHIMFFANCDAQGNKHLGGTVKLIEHEYEHSFCRDTGYFAKESTGSNQKKVLYPYENEFNEVFKKDTRGLKIIIPFLRKQNNNITDIIRSVCDNFFVAIIEKKLLVYVRDLKIDSESIMSVVENTQYYEEQNFHDIRKNFTPSYINTYMNINPVDIEVKDNENEVYKFRLYLNYDDQIKKGRMAIIRRIGMKIEDKRIKNMATAPFNAVMLPVSEKEDKFLKSLENESHTELSYEHIKDQNKFKNAKKFINNISREVGNYISDIMKKNNPVDGEIDTSDILYSVEHSFKTQLSKNVSTVSMTKHNNKSKRSIVKMRTDVKPNIGKGEGKELSEKGDKRRKPARKRNGSGEDVNRVRFRVEHEEVKRIVLPCREVFQIDLSNNEGYFNEKSCDLTFNIIDGTGKEYNNEFNMDSNYTTIMDMNKDEELVVKDNIIKNVSIYDKKIKLGLKTTDNYNNSLKFIYYVEV